MKGMGKVQCPLESGFWGLGTETGSGGRLECPKLRIFVVLEQESSICCPFHVSPAAATSK